MRTHGTGWRYRPRRWDQAPLAGCTRAFGPTHEIMALIALCKLNLQTRMRSNPLGLHVWILVRPFVYFHTLCVRTAKALARLRRCEGSGETAQMRRLWRDCADAKALARLRRCAVSPEPSQFAYAISTIISWAGSFEGSRIGQRLDLFSWGGSFIVFLQFPFLFK